MATSLRGVKVGGRTAMFAVLTMILALGGVAWAPTAVAEDPGELDVTKTVTGWTSGQVVEPGDSFVYSITISCTNIGSGGCTNAVLTDPLPEGIILDADSTVTVQGASGTVQTSGDDVTVTFTEPLTDPPGSQGLPAGATVTVNIPVRVDPDIDPQLDGEDLVNVATADGTNTEPDDGTFVVVPDIPIVVEAGASKAFEPPSGLAVPGTGTTLSLSGGNESNVPVATVQITDPSDPAAAPNPFTYLGLTSSTLDIALPDGAEQVQVDAYVDGAWVEGTPGAPPATLPTGVTPGDVTGLRITFISTDGDDIPPGAEGTASVPLEQRDNIAEAGVGAIDNEVSTVVATDEQTSDPATADAQYTITSSDLDTGATKTFTPDEIAVGGTSTVSLTGTNDSELTLDTMTIAEPGSAGPNPFENGLTFTGWEDPLVWPTGATGASVTYDFADGTSTTLETTEPNTLPDPPDGSQVTGFTVEFTGPIVPGATATLNFGVTAPDTQPLPQFTRPNTIDVDTTAPGGFSGDATATDDLITYQRRLDVDVSKRISPTEIFSIPGQVVTVLLSGTLEEFPASTTDATEIIVQDPADLESDSWYDSFAPTAITETPIPADATLTVQYWDGEEWVDVPGMVDLAGPQIFSGPLPPEVQENAQGIRFVYDSDDGFPPGTTVSPNISYELRPEAAGTDLDVENCAASSASAPDADPASADTAECPDIDLVPPDPGSADFIDKAWDVDLLGERTGREAGFRIDWSTSGASNIDQMVISDQPQPSAATVPDSVFDTFDLVRIDPITPATDPHLTYDRVARVELFSLAAGGWVDAPGDPCPAACDGTFPGYDVPTGSQNDIIAFRLVYEESPTRADRIGGDPTAPQVGSGVAASSGNDREIHAVMRLRDDRRSDPTLPVIASATYNVAEQPGDVRNTARASVIVDDEVYVDQDASDIITISPVPLTVSLTKDWTGGPLSVPAPGVPFPDSWPTARMTLDAENTTPRQIDRLTITDPTGLADPFDSFNLRGFVSITDPADIGADGLTVTLTLEGGGTRILSRSEALLAPESDLTDVVGFELVYTGRITEGAHAVVEADTRLRPTSRADGAPVEPGTTVDNRATTVGEDLIDYPDTPEVSSTASDSADIDLLASGIGLEVQKSFDPASQTEPDRAPVTMTLSGQPSGPSRAVEMVLTDVDASFWNQYDFVGFGDGFAFTAPIDQVRVDVLTGGTFVETSSGVELEGATWTEGEESTSLVLPEGIAAGDVQGLRLTFTRADGQIWENPATPTQLVPLEVQRREHMHTGGDVPSDLAGSEPAPGETVAGQATNTITGDALAADVDANGDPLQAEDDVTAPILYRHANNAVQVTKSPSGAQAPGASIPYELTFTNTGDVPIVDPVITDRLPTDADGPLLVLNPDTDEHYGYALSGPAPDPASGPPMPTDPAAVSVAEGPDLLTFTFPEDTVLEVGQTYTITVDLVFRPGLPGNTTVTNTTGIVGDRAWDGCETSLDPDTGECRTSATVYPTTAGALRGTKTVQAVDSELGVLDTRDAGCDADSEGFYAGGCVPVTKPGGEDVWRMTFTNTGNLPMDQVYALDRLPAVGDTGAIVTLPRESQWRPTPTSLRFAGASLGDVSSIRVFYDADDDICTTDLETLDGCPDGEWTLIDESADPADGWTVQLPADARALKFEMDFFDELLQPTGTVRLDLTTTAPAQSPTVGSDTIAWNTVAQAGRTNDAGTLGLAPRAEGNKVGVALATGPLEITKVVEGPASEYAPSSFELTIECTSVGQPVDLGDQSPVVLEAGEVVRIDGVPWGSECTVSEDVTAAGATAFDTTTVTVAREGEPVALVTATNTYEDASLRLAKDVRDSAVDQDGNPIVYGPFRFRVTCTFLDEPVYAAGYGPTRPMVAVFDSGETWTLSELPAGSECVATETDRGGAEETESSGTTADGTETGSESLDLVLTPDGDDPVVTNEVTFTNVFAVGSLVLTKIVEGDGAATFGAGPFTIHLSCQDVRGDSVWDGDVVLGGDQPLTTTIENMDVGATCTAEETGTGGATRSVVDPAGPFEITSDDPVTVTATNTFDLGSVRIEKRLRGDGVDELDPGLEFTVALACTLDVDGVETKIPISDDGERVLSRADGLSVVFDDLPVGAQCVVSEPDDGGADDTSISPTALTVGGDEVAEVVVTNTFDPAELGPTDDSDPASSGPEAHTGGRVVENSRLLLWGSLVALLVALAAGVARHRRRP
ncbi:isopeptide-forming domain-containing fimbrial protein [Aeromicrobium tamlense]|uniref:Fimbrial isopeptide formation D2 family protein n=1 Tax=Aeromicrobium tamlense TaxID=375541 RepID=A0A8I0FY34_9ACTN|nr:DUF5979 domain-containing protein [Aeromicrobium tamlense]MBD1270733.1 isopeptide-forming domain-containing fimbrial protein [Aeromicrobium tamlense]MBD1271135.1 isopeptide-forming domain-containing fimbrial protein [Aeromicrobium tamlense]NYI38125.1 fimbrial isopeptide formation D2 family protein [Aeromicrobium tamlense]